MHAKRQTQNAWVQDHGLLTPQQSTVPLLKSVSSVQGNSEAQDPSMVATSHVRMPLTLPCSLCCLLYSGSPPPPQSEAAKRQQRNKGRVRGAGERGNHGGTGGGEGQMQRYGTK